jgi:hypothetical protein
MWRSMKDAPKTDEPVLLKAAGDDISVAFQHDNGDWFAFEVADPSDVRYVQAPLRAGGGSVARMCSRQSSGGPARRTVASSVASRSITGAAGDILDVAVLGPSV